MRRRLLLTLLAILSLPLPLHSATLTVVPGTGNSCADLEGSFQECLDLAASNAQGDILEVTGGDYNLSATLVYTPAVGENFPITIRNADSTPPVLSSNLTVPCLQLAPGSLVDDTNADVTISGLVFERCEDPLEDGGALMIFADEADVSISQVTFTQNVSGEDGGALDINAGIDFGAGDVSIVGCIFEGNEALLGGAFSVGHGGTGTVEFRNNQVTANTSTAGSGGGGGLFVSDGGIVISGNLISGNEADGEAGGLAINASTSFIVVTNNIIASNTSTELGGGLTVNIFNPGGSLVATNNTIYGNSAGAEGGGLHVELEEANNQADIYNNIVFGNQALLEGKDIFTDEDLSNDGSTGTVNLFNNIFDAGGFFSECLANPPCTTVNGADSPTNLLEDPLLADPANGNFALGQNSPAIQAGDPAAPEMPDTDFSGNPRPTTPGTNPDIGALQFQAEPTPTPTPSPTAEIEGDGGCALATAGRPAICWPLLGLLALGLWKLINKSKGLNQV